MEDGLRWPLNPGSYSYPSPRKALLIGDPWQAHIPFQLGLAGQILAGSYLSTSDWAQTWPEDPGSLPGGDISVERAGAQERSTSESVWDCHVHKELGVLNRWVVCV